MARGVQFLPSSRPADRDFVRITREIRIGRPDAVRIKPSRANTPSPVLALLLLTVVVGAPVVIRAARSGAAPAAAPVLRCTPLRYAVDLNGAPAGIAPTVDAAFARFTDASAVPAVATGATTADVVVSWIARDRLDALANRSDALGFTIPSARPPFTGHIYLNANARLPLGFDVRHSWGGVLLHELGHLAGLPHSTDPNELMYPDVNAGGTAWGVTDQAQLHAAGARAGC